MQKSQNLAKNRNFISLISKKNPEILRNFPREGKFFSKIEALKYNENIYESGNKLNKKWEQIELKAGKNSRKKLVPLFYSEGLYLV